MTQRTDETLEQYQARERLAARERRFQKKQITLDGDGKVKSVVLGLRGADPAKVPQFGRPSATSTLYDRDGNVTAQWVKTRPEQRDPARDLELIREELTVHPLPRLGPLSFDLGGGPVADNLMVWYPVGDHHLGMLSWRPETGASYDLEIGEQMLDRAFRNLIPRAPKTVQGGIVFLGDFLHYDSLIPQTPSGKHMLDADSRYAKMVRVGLRCMRRQIEAAAAWHAELSVIVEPGNHDPFSSLFLVEALAEIYRDNPRIQIDTTPRPFHYHRFGSVLIGTHHGDRAKPEALPGIMAADRPQDWAASEHRYWWTGHVHSRNAQDFRGCTWESFRILPPADAWAAGRGYRSTRDMKAIVLHHRHGEVARFTVNPAMLED